MVIHEEVIAFINKFTSNSKRQEVIDCFSHGCCYWFAHILNDRFWKYFPMIVYDEVENHWACRIYDRVYDITGDVTDRYNWIPWESIALRDIKLYNILMRDCIEMKSNYE